MERIRITPRGNKRIRISASSEGPLGNKFPAKDFSQFLPDMADREYRRLSFQATFRFYFSNRDSDDEKFSTSFANAGFTQSDRDFSTRALKNSFFILELQDAGGDSRVGFIFINLNASNIILSEGQDFPVEGKAYILRSFSDDYASYPYQPFFYNSRLGIRSEFRLDGEETDYSVNLDSGTLAFSGDVPIVFREVWNPYIENTQEGEGSSRALRIPNDYLQGPEGQLQEAKILDCSAEDADFQESQGAAGTGQGIGFRPELNLGE